MFEAKVEETKIIRVECFVDDEPYEVKYKKAQLAIEEEAERQCLRVVYPLTSRVEYQIEQVGRRLVFFALAVPDDSFSARFKRQFGISI